MYSDESGDARKALQDAIHRVVLRRAEKGRLDGRRRLERCRLRRRRCQTSLEQFAIICVKMFKILIGNFAAIFGRALSRTEGRVEQQ